MLTYLKELFTDKTFFMRTVRSIAGGIAVGLAAAGGAVPHTGEQWLAVGLAFLSTFLSASPVTVKDLEESR